MFKSIITFVILCPLVALAHDGHHHAPSAFTAQKGGVTRSLESIHLEMLSQGNTVKIFIFDLKTKPADTGKYPVSATVKLPRQKPTAIKLKKMKHHWQYQFDAKGAHRYTLEFTIKQDGHNDPVKWNIEPQRTRKHSHGNGHTHQH